MLLHVVVRARRCLAACALRPGSVWDTTSSTSELVSGLPLKPAAAAASSSALHLVVVVPFRASRLPGVLATDALAAVLIHEGRDRLEMGGIHARMIAAEMVEL
jgi:hypothetical protein